MFEQENDLSVASGYGRSSKNKDFDTNSALDSGFLSGPQAIYSGEINSASDDDDHHSMPMQKSSTEKCQQQLQIDTNIDSGCIIDSQMFSKGDETGLPENFNNLSIKENPLINNLDSIKEKSNQQQYQQQLPQQRNNLWKSCYRQDNDGDT